MRLREGGKPDGSAALLAFSGVAAFRADHFAGVWDVRPAKANRAREVRGVVVRDVCTGGDCFRLADVSVFPVRVGPGGALAAPLSSSDKLIPTWIPRAGGARDSGSWPKRVRTCSRAMRQEARRGHQLS